MIWGVLGAIAAIFTTVGLGYSVYDIISTGAWHDWNLFDWIVNIGLCVLSIFPFFSAFRGATTAAAVARGGILAKLESLPLIGKVVTWVWAIYISIKEFLRLAVAPFFARGGFLFKMGTAFAIIARMAKKPWVLAGLLFLSATADGIFRHVYQLWGDLSLRAMSVAYDRVGAIMDDAGYGDPIGDAVMILRGAKETLPPCFTAVWGLVGASECIGLIITTFQYMFLLAALLKGFRIYESYGGK